MEDERLAVWYLRNYQNITKLTAAAGLLLVSYDRYLANTFVEQDNREIFRKIMKARNRLLDVALKHSTQQKLSTKCKDFLVLSTQLRAAEFWMNSWSYKFLLG